MSIPAANLKINSTALKDFEMQKKNGKNLNIEGNNRKYIFNSEIFISAYHKKGLDILENILEKLSMKIGKVKDTCILAHIPLFISVRNDPRGCNSIIKDNGTGSLILASDNVAIQNVGQTETMATFQQDAGTALFFDNAQ